jgi:hypothetical protein
MFMAQESQRSMKIEPPHLNPFPPREKVRVRGIFKRNANFVMNETIRVHPYESVVNPAQAG